MKLPLPALIAVEKALNAVLLWDPDMQPRLSAIHGKTVCINVTAPRLSVMLSIRDGQISLDQPASAETLADSTISGSLSDLHSLINSNDAIYTGRVKIEGDLEVSQQLKHIIADMDPDWQEAISPWLGDSITHQLDVTQSRFSRWFERTTGSLRSDTKDYLQEEAELLAPTSEIAAFCEAIDELQASVDRFAARLQRIEKQHRPQDTLSSGEVEG